MAGPHNDTKKNNTNYEPVPDPKNPNDVLMPKFSELEEEKEKGEKKGFFSRIANPFKSLFKAIKNLFTNEQKPSNNHDLNGMSDIKPENTQNKWKAYSENPNLSHNQSIKIGRNQAQNNKAPQQESPPELSLEQIEKEGKELEEKLNDSTPIKKILNDFDNEPAKREEEKLKREKEIKRDGEELDRKLNDSNIINKIMQDFDNEVGKNPKSYNQQLQEQKQKQNQGNNQSPGRG